MTAAELEERLLQFTRAKLAGDFTGSVTSDTLLFEARVLDSLRILELIAFLEAQLGRPIPDAQVVLANFRSIRAMSSVFGTGGEPAVAAPRRGRLKAERIFQNSTSGKSYHRGAIEELLSRGEMEIVALGEIRLHDAALSLSRYFDDTIRGWAAELGAVDAEYPEAIEMETLDRAGFLAAFPQKLVMNRGTGGALAPAVCYHAYPRLHARSVDEAGTLVTSVGRCFREEQDADHPLERLRAFTMREVIVAGGEAAVERLRDTMIARVSAWVKTLGLDGYIETATDPFFTTETRGRKLMQQARPLKYELRLGIAAGRTVAAASFNNHERHFGRAFDIRTGNGETAFTGCVAFGWERWVLAFISQHGADEAGWPDAVRTGHESVA